MSTMAMLRQQSRVYFYGDSDLHVRIRWGLYNAPRFGLKNTLLKENPGCVGDSWRNQASLFDRISDSHQLRRVEWL